VFFVPRCRSISSRRSPPTIHLHERLLHVLDVGGGVVHHPFAMAQVRAQTDHAVAGTEAATEQSVLVQLLEPLGRVHVGLPARDILDIARIHQQHLEAARLEDLENGESSTRPSTPSRPS
jgi:hypothetical protein